MEAARYVVAVIEALECAHIPYMIVGSLAAGAYGITRSTKDADFVVQSGSTPLSAIVRQLGPEFLLDRQMSFETTTGTFKHVIDVAQSGFQIELFRLSDDAHDQQRFQRRRETFVPILSRNVFIPSVEDVIVTKLRWVRDAGRPKDRDDVAAILAVQRDQLDWTYLRHWADQHQTTALLEEIRAELPDI